MSKKIFAVLVAGAMAASVQAALPASAATSIPATVQIDDPAGDASTLGGDTALPAGGNVSNVGDLRKVWFSHTDESVSVHIQTTIAPPASGAGILYTVLASPGEGPVTNQTAGCLQFRVFIEGGTQGGTYQGERSAKLHDRCNEGTNWINNGVAGEVVVETLDDGTGLTTLTFPRAYSALLASGAKLSAPTARSDGLVGTDAASTPATPATGEAYPWAGYRYDDTKVGTDYEIGAGGTPTGTTVVADEPKAKKKKKKNCNKIKNKQKRAKCKKQQKKKVTKGCAAYTPGEMGAEAETLVVTDKATEEAPLEFTIEHEAALPRVAEQTLYRNLQVSTKGKDAGLFVRYEFAPYEDHDLYLFHSTGNQAAMAAGFNPAATVEQPILDAVLGRGAGHSEMGAEQISALRTVNCGGYTADLTNFMGTGGEYTVKAWLGEAEFDPDAP